MKALKVIEQTHEPEIAEGLPWNGRLQMASFAPNGVKKLRELILELAVRGKLVPQDPKDEPASVSLKNNKIDLKNKTSPLKGWAVAAVGEVISLEYGKSLPDRDRSGTGEVDVFGSNGVVGTHHTGFINRPCIVVGRKGSSGALNPSRKKSCWVTDVAYFILIPEYFDFQFLFYSLKTLGLETLGKGIKPGLNRNEAYQLPINIPPLAEQQRIVAKVDELMALCDRLEAQKEDAATAHEMLVKALLGTLTQSQTDEEFQQNWRRIANSYGSLFSSFANIFSTESSIDALKQTILQLAVMGKLVPQDPSDESASELLKRIRAEKEKLVKAGKIRKDKEQSKILDADVLYDLPKGWEWESLLNCSKLVTDGEHLTPERTPDTTQVPLVTAKNVRDGYLDFGNTDFVPQKIAEKCWGRCKPEKNDILVVSVGATTGRLSICKTETDMVIVRSVTLIKPLFINVEYLALALKSPFLQRMIWKGVKQNAQPCLYLSVSQALSIPVPPLAEQQRIVAKVDELMALCDSLKERLAEYNSLHEHLATALVEKAVAGD